MQQHAITMLGTGLIGDFYAMTLHGQRGRDRVRVVYSRSEARTRAFSERWGIPETTTDMEVAIRHPRPTSSSSRCPNHLHEEAVAPPRPPARPSCAPSRWAAPPPRRSGCSRPSSEAGVFGGYLEDLVLHAEDAQGGGVGRGRARSAT